MNEIVMAVPMRDFIVIFTRNGDIYRMDWSHFDGNPTIHLMAKMFRPEER